MQTYTFSRCIELLDVDAKVFRRWVREDLKLGEKDQVSRADNRVRYLTREQLEQLAQLHDKTLPADDQIEGEDEHVSPGAYKLLVDRLDALEKTIEGVLSDIGSFSGDITHMDAHIGSLRELFEHPETGLDAHLKVLEHRIAELEVRTQPGPSAAEQQQSEREAAYQQRIAELEAQLAAYQQQEKKSAPPPPKKKPVKKKKRPALKALPAALVARNAFAKLHNVSEKLVSKAALDGKIATTEGKWLSGGYVVTRALNAKGKHDFYHVFHERPDFQRCDQCPHEIKE
jgi:DNA repair exonuclease SbcCD ATPase subunit